MPVTHNVTVTPMMIPATGLRLAVGRRVGYGVDLDSVIKKTNIFKYY